MQLLNLNIDRIIIHQVYQRDTEGQKKAAMRSHEFTRFSSDAMETFKQRVIEALGEGSRAVQMEIVHQEPANLPQIVDRVIDESDDTFAVSSYDFATLLTDAQQMKSIPGGIVVVFTGTQGHPAKKFLGIIKAETHSAYEKEIDDSTGEISLKYVEEVLLTPSSKLYKTAGFFEKASYSSPCSDLNEKWTVMVSDSQINKAGGKAAARYFYADFLGCGYPQTSARTTKQFYESAKDFISGLDAPESKKSDYINALTTYLKVDTSSSISTDDFAEKYFETEIQDAFSEHMESAGIPTTSFTKDIEHISSNLKFRKVRFSKNVKISAPSDSFKELINISTIEGDSDESGMATEWTKVIIKDKIVTQE
ncbi:nucleoid associated protein NdpA [Idiomarina aquatica]|uniref:Nucleoid associated protein NdpA n=1 Tax=Idiomarina aquatica TaxID=1327752 RepID=A0A4R6P0S9_9GAMM|nr:nucleoid-associated protein [Idiomarina aquatica]TDP30766.1 nucleoid associated protein NdpA [Idiomarina aquatica]